MTSLMAIEGTEIDGFRSDGATAIDKAKTLAHGIKDSASLDAAATMMLDAKARIRVIEDRLKEPRQHARAAWQSIVDLTTELCEPFLRIEREILKPAMVRYSNEQERLRRQEEDKLRDEQKKRAEDERIKQAAALERDGDKEAAQELIEAPVEVAPVVVPKAEAPAGISYRDVWKYRVTDETKVPREYLMLDEKKIAAVVRALKGETRIGVTVNGRFFPAIEAYAEKTVAGRL